MTAGSIVRDDKMPIEIRGMKKRLHAQSKKTSQRKIFSARIFHLQSDFMLCNRAHPALAALVNGLRVELAQHDGVLHA